MNTSDDINTLKLRGRKIKKSSECGSDSGETIISEKDFELVIENPEIELNPTIKMADLNVSLALKIIPEFDGSSANLHRFLSCCDIVHDSLKNTEIKSFLQILRVKLIGKAYEVVKFEEFQDWKSLKDTLKSQFTSKRSLESIQLELNSIKQKISVDVKTFANKIEKLHYQLNEACLSESGIKYIKDIKKIIIR